MRDHSAEFSQLTQDLSYRTDALVSIKEVVAISGLGWRQARRLMEAAGVVAIGRRRYSLRSRIVFEIRRPGGA